MEYESNFLKRTKKFMILFGTWPLDISHFTNLVYRIYGNIVLTYYTLFIVSLFLQLKDISSASPESQAYVLQYDFTYTFVLWKVILSQKASVRKLMKIISETEAKILNGNDNSLKNIYKKCLEYNARVFNMFLWSFIIIVSLYTAVTFAEIKSWSDTDIGSNTTTSEKKLPLPQAFPFANKISFHLKYAVQFSARVMAGFMFPGCDTLFMSLVYFAAAHLKVLGHKFKHFGDNTDDPEIFVKNLVMEHKAIIDYTTQLNEILKWILSIDFLLQSYHITLSLMDIMTLIEKSVINMNFIVTLSLSVTFLMVTFLQMCCLYFNSNEVVVESMELTNNIFQSNWYEQSPAVKRSFIIIIKRSQKPLELKIGNLYPITNDLIVKFVKAGFTYVLLSRLDS